MPSKYYLLCCLSCGEYVTSIMHDSIEQFEIHMCLGSTTPLEKRQKLLQPREAVNTEIAKSGPPPPPPMPSQASLQPVMQPGSSHSHKSPQPVLSVPISTPNSKSIALRNSLASASKVPPGLEEQFQSELKAAVQKRRDRMHPY